MKPSDVVDATLSANTLGEVLRHAARLREVSASPELDLQLLLAKLLERPRTWILAHPEAILTTVQQQAARAMIARRMRGEPVAYITGTREFWSMAFEVTPAVLIPRPDTELLVEVALGRFGMEPREVAEIGTGSGAIAIALACERPAWHLVANDIEAAAVRVAAANAQRLLPPAGHIDFVIGDGCDAFGGQCFDMIVSNPPYVAETDRARLAPTLAYEPAGALFAGVDGLAVIRQIVAAATHALRPGGWLLLEHGWNQQPEVAALMAGAGYHDITLHRDLADQPRVTCGHTAR